MKNKVYIGQQESFMDGAHSTEHPVAFATKELAHQWQKTAMQKYLKANDIDLSDTDCVWERSLLGITSKGTLDEEWVIWPIYELEVKQDED